MMKKIMITFSSTLAVPNTWIVIYKSLLTIIMKKIMITFSSALAVPSSWIVIIKGLLRL